MIKYKKYFLRIKKVFNKLGFTLIELLVVIAIIGVLSTMGFMYYRNVKVTTRDIDRLNMLNVLRKGLALYYTDKGYYPSAGGNGWYAFNYQKREPDGSCVDDGWDNWDGQLKFDNSTSPGFLDVLFDYGYISDGLWTDPLNPVMSSSYNCRYVIPCYGITPCYPKSYLLHCNLEEMLYREVEDGGDNDTLYEVLSDPWICVLGNYN